MNNGQWYSQKETKKTLLWCKEPPERMKPQPFFISKMSNQKKRKFGIASCFKELQFDKNQNVNKTYTMKRPSGLYHCQRPNQQSAEFEK